MPKEMQNGRSYDLMVVEDNADDLELFLRALRKVQLEIGVDIRAHPFSDSTQAAGQLKERKFDAIFLDIDMPPPDGMELARLIRRSGINDATPVIVITGSAERNLVNRAFESGAHLVLFKPVDRQQLLRLLQLTLPEMSNEKNQAPKGRR